MIWMLLVLLAWPDQLALLTNPFVATFVSIGIAGVLLEPKIAGVCGERGRR